MESEAELKEADDQEELPRKNVTDPLDTDVLCGRGGAALRHPGNKTYRTLVQLNKGLYITCIKSEKLKISKSIVAAIREQKGRFLEKNKAGTWDDIGDRKATEKTSQALREGQPKLKQKIAELGGTAAAAMAQNQGYSAPRHSYSNSDGNLAAAAAAAAAFAAHDYAAYDPQSQQHPSIDQHTVAAFRNHSFLRNSMTPLQVQSSASEELPPPVGEIIQQLSLSNIQEEPNVNRMRPSMLQRGSVIAHELGVDPQSSRSLLSEFSNYGMADSCLSMETGSRRSLVGLDLTHQNLASAQEEKELSTMDRRRFFAKMKVNRVPSAQRMSASGRMNNASGRNIDSARSLGDGMPDIHLVGSNMSLYSNMSSIGDAGEALESRRSVMSGLSRISDTEDANSIFSDLSKKIGNVSTRSMAMSEISNMDDIDSLDTPEKQVPPQPMTSSSMELE